MRRPGRRALRVYIGILARKQETQDGTQRKTVVAQGRPQAGGLARAPVGRGQSAVPGVEMGLVGPDAVRRHRQFEVDQPEVTVGLNNQVVGREIADDDAVLVHNG